MAEENYQLALPRFTRTMKTLAAVLALVWLLEVLLQGTPVGGYAGPLGPFEPLALVPAAVVTRGHVWQLATYALLHDPSSAVALAFTAVALWFMASPLERSWGARRVLALMGAASLAGAVAVVLAGLAWPPIFRGVTVGPSAAVSALLAAWCLARPDERLSLFGLAVVTGRQLLVGAVAITALQLAWARNGAGVAALAGFPVAWAFVRWQRRRDDAPRGRRPASGARFRVIQGGGGGDLPN